MKKSVVIIIAVTVVAVIFYGIRHFGTSVEVQEAKASVKEGKISASGVVVYSEHMYTARNDGTFYSYTREGEKVGKDRVVATVYNGIVDKEVLQSLNNIDKKISDIENDNSSVYTTDEASAQIVMENIKNDITDAVTEGDVSQIYEYKNKLKIAAGVSNEAEQRHSLDELKEEKRKTEEKITQSRKDIYSDLSGIYTTSLDGLEEVIKPEDLAEYKVADYYNLKSPEDKIMGNRTVKSGEGVCKVVDNHEWYVICVVSKNEKNKINIGDGVKLRIEKLPGTDVDAKIEYISEEEENADEYLVTLKCDQYLEGIFNIRISNIEIILNSFYGYEIPVYAIRIQDGKAGVMVMGKDKNEEIFRECEILHRNDETETIIIGPSNTKNSLKDGDKIILREK